jgi:hypothetical protein
VHIGQLDRSDAELVIDATGRTACAGFIDMYLHSDLPLLLDGDAHSQVRQGITLDLIGEGDRHCARAKRWPSVPRERSDLRRSRSSKTVPYFGRFRKAKTSTPQHNTRSMPRASTCRAHRIPRAARRASWCSLGHCMTPSTVPEPVQ